MRALLLACTALLSACASLPPAPPTEPALRLSPASLGRELVLQQRMTVQAMGRSQQLDVAIEVDPQAVRMAVMDLGHTVARLEWDGQTLQQSRAPGWPASVTGERVLSDFQLVHWPLAAIAPALPAGWSVRQEGGERVLRYRGDAMVRVRYPADGTAEIDNLAAGYSIRLENWRAVQ